MSGTSEDDIEQTLHIARSVSIYRIPPRPGASGWRSGEWLVSDKLFNGRLRVVSRGELCEVRLEDPNSNDLFATCPVAYGQRNVVVEAVSDSSRYFVLRVEDAGSGRHAFLGMGFDNRSDAFDFNEALVRHEQQVARERAARERCGGQAGASSSSASPAPSSSSSAAPSWIHRGAAGPAAGGAAVGASSSAAAEVEVLYRHTADLRLQEGQTLRVNVNAIKKPGAAGGGKGGFLSSATAAAAVSPLLPPPPAASPAAVVPSVPPPHPPVAPFASPSSCGGLAPPPLPPPTQQAAAQVPKQPCHPADQRPGLVGGGPPPPGHQAGLGPAAQAWPGSMEPVAAGPGQALGQANWATFD